MRNGRSGRLSSKISRLITSKGSSGTRMKQASPKQRSLWTKIGITLLVMFLIAAALQIGPHIISSRTDRSPARLLEGIEPDSSSTEKQTRIKTILQAMTPEEKAGQLLMFGFSEEDEHFISQMISRRQIGGVIIFERNVRDAGQVIRMNQALQRRAYLYGSLPLFIAVDQEGEPVDRLGSTITCFPGPRDLGRLNSPYYTWIAARDTARELKALGFNVNLAPVLDIAGEDSIVYERSYGDAAWQVCSLGQAAVNGYRQGGVIPCAKHFPGIGFAVDDPHEGTVEIEKNLNELEESDLRPFRHLIAADVEMVLVSNALYPALDPDAPACFSPIIVKDLLRENMAYDGLILCDDLEMGAALSHNSTGRLAVDAVKAGADIVLVCHSPEKQAEAYNALVEAIKSGEINEQQLNETLNRIITIKMKWQLGSQQAVPEKAAAVIKNQRHQEDARQIMTELNRKKDSDN